MTYELFAYWRTSAVYRVRVALALKRLDAVERFVDLDHGGQRDPEFLRINPMAAIPALVVDPDHPPLTQSLAILEYLEDMHPTPPLLPTDPLARARVRSLALMLAADTHPFIVPRVRRHLTDRNGLDPAEWKAWQAHWLTTGLQAYEKRLAAEPGAGRFSHGDDVTIADICLMSLVVVTRVFAIQIPDIPTIERIAITCGQMQEFADAEPNRQRGAPSTG